MARRAVVLLAALGGLVPPSFGARPLPAGTCGTSTGLTRELVARHRLTVASPHARSTGPGDRDVADVALVEDRGDLVTRRNPFDLDRLGIRFEPRDDGWAMAPLGLAPSAPGTPLAVERDAPVALALPFPFPFAGRVHSRAFVHADGSLTLGEAGAGGEPGLATFVDGPPRLAPFFAPLDPARGGRVSVRLDAFEVRVQWSDVPGAAQLNRNTFELALRSDGSVDFVYGERLETREAVVGLTPGGGSTPTAVDLSRAQPVATAAVVERFAERERLDLVAVVRRFLAGHADAFEQVVVYTTRPLNPLPGSLAFQVNVRNDVRGIGLERFDDSAAWGSAGTLESVVFMDAIDPYLEVDGFELLGHEVGHRWLARLPYQDASGRLRTATLGRADVHWSFFLDSDASVLEGNDIADLGGGRFETVDIVRRYSPLDQYAMGLRAAAEVPAFFLVAEPGDFRPNRGYKSSSQPEAGVRFTGRREEVSLAQVRAALGPREPAADQAPRLLRQAYVLVADAEAPATPEQLEAVARIRGRFPGWYAAATDGRGVVETRLRPDSAH